MREPTPLRPAHTNQTASGPSRLRARRRPVQEVSDKCCPWRAWIQTDASPGGGGRSGVSGRRQRGEAPPGVVRRKGLIRQTRLGAVASQKEDMSNTVTRIRVAGAAVTAAASIAALSACSSPAPSSGDAAAAAPCEPAKGKVTLQY